MVSQVGLPPLIKSTHTQWCTFYGPGGKAWSVRGVKVVCTQSGMLKLWQFIIQIGSSGRLANLFSDSIMIRLYRLTMCTFRLHTSANTFENVVPPKCRKIINLWKVKCAADLFCKQILILVHCNTLILFSIIILMLFNFPLCNNIFFYFFMCIFFLLIKSSSNIAALNISTGPLALRTFQTAEPVRASTLYLSLALQDHRVKCRASRLKITVARSMTNFATFSCILFLKFRYVCIAWLL